MARARARNGIARHETSGLESAEQQQPPSRRELKEKRMAKPLELVPEPVAVKEIGVSSGIVALESGDGAI